MSRGRFITVEGIEGTGKSSNIAFLTEHIEAAGFEVVTTREPGGTPLAERIRALLLEHGDEPVTADAELLLFFAARSLHLRNRILPALDRGQWVVCDRFTDATRAYQGCGRGLDPARIEALATWVQGDVEPDLTLLLDAPAEVGMQRTESRGNGDRMDKENLAFYRRVRDGYLALARQHRDRFRVVDASRPLVEVQQAIANHLAQFLDDK